MKIVRRMRKSTWGLLASLAAVAALGLTTMFTLGGFSAVINNNSSTFSSATIQLEENQAGTGITCYSTGSGAGGTVTATNTNSGCAINALVGTLDQVPGGAALTTNLTFTNVGNHAASIAQLTTGACTAAAASDSNGYVGADLTGTPPAYCGKVDISVNNNTLSKCVYPSGASACGALLNANNLGTIANTVFTTNMSTLAAGASATYTVTVQLDNAVATNADQGLTATVPMTWTISQ